MICTLEFCGTARIAKTDKWQKLASNLLFLRPVVIKLAKDRENTGFGHKNIFGFEFANWIETNYPILLRHKNLGRSPVYFSKNFQRPARTAGPSDHLYANRNNNLNK